MTMTMRQETLPLEPTLDERIKHALELQQSGRYSAAQWIFEANVMARNDPTRLAEAAEILAAVAPSFPLRRP